MKVVQFGLPYSPNLGDGVIAECLAHAIRCRVPGAEVVTLDLSGRRAFGAVTLRNRALALRVLALLPRTARRALVAWRLERMLNGAAPGWQAAAKGADMAIIGGGQLFSDADLNFCLKVARAARVCAAQDLPLAIHGVGVSQNWSRRGTALFLRVFEGDLRQVGVRDAASLRAWVAQVGARVPAPRLTRDPGLLAADCYGRPAGPAAGGDAGDRRIGVCVTDPAVLHYHADGPVAGAGSAGLEFFADLARALCAAGHAVSLFTNGAKEDCRALARLAASGALTALTDEGAVRIEAAPARPIELAHMIARFRGVVAHRLHAGILAFAYEVPAVGLGWDSKVAAFFASVGAERFCVSAAEVAAGTVAALLDQAVAEGGDAEARARAVAETWEAVDAMLAACS